ncbi:hypothetical protein, partial [Macellibacteroides fermentans]
AIYWFLDGLLATSNINYLMLAVILFMSLLVILKNKTMALFASLLIGVGSLYMIFAVLSEYSEFPRGDANGFKLLLTGAIIFLSTLLISILLPIKYFKRKQSLSQNT